MKSLGLLSLVALLALPACGTRALAPAATTASAEGHEVLPFIHDDYPRALAEAKKTNKPLFVDAWATWCHSCMSLKTFVLTDPKLAPLANDFVWLSIDTEKDSNANWVQTHPHDALPTLWVVDPKTDRRLLKWAGTVTADELKTLLTVATHDTSGGGMDATAAFVRGNHALAEGDLDGAEKEHRAALAAAPKDHPQRARIVETLVTQLALRKKAGDCAELAATEADSLPLGTSRASTLVAGLGCAREAKRDKETDQLFAIALKDASARDGSLLPDDRSALYEEVVATKEARGDAAGAHTLATEWAAFLEDAAKKAKTADARTSIDPLRLSAYFALHEPARAIPMLETSAKDFPDDYNPPARLGRVYLELRRLDEATKETDKAIAKVYGPRAMRVYALKADIAKARGDRAGESQALEEALARSGKGAVLTDGQKGVRAALEKRLAGLK